MGPARIEGTEQKRNGFHVKTTTTTNTPTTNVHRKQDDNKRSKAAFFKYPSPVTYLSWGHEVRLVAHDLALDSIHQFVVLGVTRRALVFAANVRAPPERPKHAARRAARASAIQPGALEGLNTLDILLRSSFFFLSRGLHCPFLEVAPNTGELVLHFSIRRWGQVLLFLWQELLVLLGQTKRIEVLAGVERRGEHDGEVAEWRRIGRVWVPHSPVEPLHKGFSELLPGGDGDGVQVVRLYQP